MRLLLVLCGGKFKVLGGSFGCLAGLKSRGAALVKKRNPISEEGVVQKCGKRRRFLAKLLGASWEGVEAWAEEFQGRWVTR